jgi:hypothetical protein
MGRNPAAVRRRLADLANVSAVLERHDPRNGLPPVLAFQNFLAIPLGVHVKHADRFAMIDDLAQCGARLHDLRRQTVHLQVMPIAEDEARIPVEHAKALRDAVHRDIELLLFLDQLSLDLQERTNGAFRFARAAKRSYDWTQRRREPSPCAMAPGPAAGPLRGHQHANPPRFVRARMYGTGF